MNTHTHHHPHHDQGQAFAIGIALNAVFVLVEIAYGLKANSLALLADAGHNASDVLGLFIAWGAAVLARRKATERFTYGLQSASIIAALANALLLMTAVSGISWEAIHRLGTPLTPQISTVIAVAAAGILVNGATAWLFHANSKHDLNVRGAFLHMALDAAVSLGVALSGMLILVTGWLWIDPLVSLAIAAVIVGSTWRLLKESVTLSLHAVPENIDATGVTTYLESLGGVREVHDLHIWAMSTTGVAMSAHLVMPGGHPGDAFIRQVAETLERNFHITHATFQIEMGDEGKACLTECTHELRH